MVPEFDLRSIEKNATDVSNFELRDGRTCLRAEESAFSGWSVQRFSGTGEVANLVRFENGMAVKAHSWKPNREKCPDTTLTGGSGSVFVYFDNGNRAGESHYTQGQLNGMKVTWHENGEKSQEAFYQHGKLNGVFVKRHRNGQKIEETNYSDDLENGSYSLWTNKGQKIEEGSYLAGKRDGERTIWTPDGIKDREETYLDGNLVSTPQLRRQVKGWAEPPVTTQCAPAKTETATTRPTSSSQSATVVPGEVAPKRRAVIGTGSRS